MEANKSTTKFKVGDRVILSPEFIATKRKENRHIWENRRGVIVSIKAGWPSVSVKLDVGLTGYLYLHESFLLPEPK